MTVLLKAIYKFNATSTKIPITFLTGIEAIILKFTCKHGSLCIAKVMLNKKSIAGSIAIPNLTPYHGAMIMQKA
jgi:hypothetical protein